MEIYKCHNRKGQPVERIISDLGIVERVINPPKEWIINDAKNEIHRMNREPNFGTKNSIDITQRRKKPYFYLDL